MQQPVHFFKSPVVYGFVNEVSEHSSVDITEPSVSDEGNDGIIIVQYVRVCDPRE